MSQIKQVDAEKLSVLVNQLIAKNVPLPSI